MKKFTAIVLSLLLAGSLSAGCGQADMNAKTNHAAGGSGNSTDDTAGKGADSTDDAAAGSSGNSADHANPADVDFSQTDADMFTDRDYEAGYDENSSILIQLNGTSASASSDSVKISGTTITITENTTHIISGTLDDGMIIVDAEDTAKLQLVFNGANIHSETSAPLYILKADKVFATLADGTDNTLSNGGTFTAVDKNNIDSVIFSKQDLTLNGSGTLSVRSPAGHGIVSKDDLVITGGTYDVSCASHGLDANDSVRITGSTSLTIAAGKDGIHAENNDDTSLGFVYISDGSIKIEAEGDGISAGAYMQMEDGAVDILAGGGSENGAKQSSDFWGGFKGGKMDGVSSATVTTDGGSSDAAADTSSSSMKGFKADGGMLFANGTININSADDAIHSNTSVTVNGGTFEIASGDDAVHADENLAITAGTINITESYEGLEALSIAITGGDIRLTAKDDGINAAGGRDSSGINGGRDAVFDGEGEDRAFGGHGGGGKTSSSGGKMEISGGSIYIKMGGDGLDANGSILITGGTIIVSGADSGDTSILDFDTEGTISGGTFIGTGASGMAQNFSSSSTQGVIMVTTGSQPSGTEIKLTDANGSVLMPYTADRDFSCVIISDASIAGNGSYTLTAGSSSFDITMDGTVYGTGSSGGRGGMRSGAEDPGRGGMRGGVEDPGRDSMRGGKNDASGGVDSAFEGREL